RRLADAADFIAAVQKAMARTYPGVPVFPAWPRGPATACVSAMDGVPSYGASPMFIKESEDFSHGLNERTPDRRHPAFDDYYLSLIPDLSK
ncbi:MAG: hypothetical protein WDM92_14880, partial [Caulobacteraceae bacterium]